MIELGWLAFLAEAWFVIPFYAIGVLGAFWVVWDAYHVNTPLKTAMRWAWPIIVLFFGPVGLALHFLTARAPGIGSAKDDDEKMQQHNAYVRANWFHQTTGAVIHCVGGDGIGIITAMILARIAQRQVQVGVGGAVVLLDPKERTVQPDCVSVRPASRGRWGLPTAGRVGE